MNTRDYSLMKAVYDSAEHNIYIVLTDLANHPEHLLFRWPEDESIFDNAQMVFFFSSIGRLGESFLIDEMRDDEDPDSYHYKAYQA